MKMLVSYSRGKTTSAYGDCINLNVSFCSFDISEIDHVQDYCREHIHDLLVADVNQDFLDSLCSNSIDEELAKKTDAIMQGG